MMMFFNGRRLKVACFDDRVGNCQAKDGSCTTRRRRRRRKHAAAVNVDLADGP